MKHLKKKWLKLTYLIFQGTAINIISMVIIGSVFDQFIDQPKQEYLDNLSKSELIILGVFFAPLIESLLLISVILILNKITKNSIIVIVITGILFGLGHYVPGENWSTPIILTVSGVIYATYYIKAKGKKVSGYLTIFFIHAISNLFVMLPDIMQ